MLGTAQKIMAVFAFAAAGVGAMIGVFTRDVYTTIVGSALMVVSIINFRAAVG